MALWPLVCVAGLTLVAGCSTRVEITEPLDGSKQEHKVVVKGTTNNVKAQIYLFVRALPDGEYVLQPSVWVRGQWDGTALLGSSYEAPGGEYEILAIASKRGLDLVPGPVEALPDKYDGKSNVVKVQRVD
jgi:hypothetical protein